MRSFHDTFERLKTLLNSESEALRLGKTTDLGANADAKARILLELTQWRNIGNETALTADEASALVMLLNDNARLLERHMLAANRVAAGLAQHLRDHESDGTYGSGQTYRGYAA